MATRTLKLEIPFQKLLSIIDHLDADEKLILKKKSLKGRRLQPGRIDSAEH